MAKLFFILESVAHVYISFFFIFFKLWKYDNTITGDLGNTENIVPLYITVIFIKSIWFTKSCLTLWPHRLQHAKLPCPSLSSRVYSDSCSLSWWCHPSLSRLILSWSFNIKLSKTNRINIQKIRNSRPEKNTINQVNLYNFHKTVGYKFYSISHKL